MSNIAQGEQLTSTEVLMVENLAALANSGSGQAIQKTGPNTFANVSILSLISASSPLSYSQTTGVLTISKSSGSSDGYLSSADWSTFNNKVSVSRNVTAGTGLSGGGNLSADVTLNLANTAVTASTYTHPSITVDAQGRITAASSIATTKRLFSHVVDAGNVTTGETDLYSDTIAAGQLASIGDTLSGKYGGTFAASATATREVRLYFAGTAIFDSTALSATSAYQWNLYFSIIRVSASVVRYIIDFEAGSFFLSPATTIGELTGLTLANTTVLKITGQAAATGAATNDIIAKAGYVNYEPI